MTDGVWKATVWFSIHISYESKSKRIYLAHKRHTGKWTNDIWLRIMSSKHEKCKWLFMIIGAKKWTIKCTTVPPVKTQSFMAAVWESLNKKAENSWRQVPSNWHFITVWKINTTLSIQHRPVWVCVDSKAPRNLTRKMFGMISCDTTGGCFHWVFLVVQKTFSWCLRS